VNRWCLLAVACCFLKIINAQVTSLLPVYYFIMLDCWFVTCKFVVVVNCNDGMLLCWLAACCCCLTPLLACCCLLLLSCALGGLLLAVAD
jgi:hypothetical protein